MLDKMNVTREQEEEMDRESERGDRAQALQEQYESELKADIEKIKVEGTTQAPRPTVTQPIAPPAMSELRRLEGRLTSLNRDADRKCQAMSADSLRRYEANLRDVHNSYAMLIKTSEEEANELVQVLGEHKRFRDNCARDQQHVMNQISGIRAMIRHLEDSE